MKFDGYKTYIVAGATILYAVCGVIIGKVPLDVAIPLILGALGFGGLRHGLSKQNNNKQVTQPQQ